VRQSDHLLPVCHLPGRSPPAPPCELKTCLSPHISNGPSGLRPDGLGIGIGIVDWQWALHFSAITRPLQLFNAFNYICWLALNVFIINRINIDTAPV